ncbi:polysaccharide biosynthesis protein [Rhodohalobacter sulfatireducens]|uniref:Polysaccharide biosynthesis protein n=1 Tax=Rhodohalobacter sulfatireducens TaxID=2911366 RepID=A0ABS9KHW9_9BACT|nr:nucleoside-diphosphate sugar epimerase/dehydratase [Rhodohalobacter sulfatireducens]MCG2590421.1 polysaccharide biosynthesis protein [Rhodohalobacter sulfatireducens]
MATLKGYSRRALFFIAGDAVAILLASFISAFILTSISGYSGELSLLNLLIYITLSLLFLGLFKMYRVSWRFTSLRELLMIVNALTIAAVTFTGYLIISGQANSMELSLLAITYLQSILYVGAFRISKRVNLEIFQNQNHEKRAIVFGAGNAGDQIMRDIKRHKHWNLNIIAIFDDDEHLHGLSMHGVPIKGDRNKMIQFLRYTDIDELIIAIPSLPKQELKSVLNRIKDLKPNLKVKVLPSFHLLSDDPVGVKNIREISIDDILGREPAKIDMDTIRSSVEGKTVLITGAGGSIGREIVRQCASLNVGKLIALDIDETEVFHIQKEFQDGDVNLVPYVANVIDEQKMSRLLETEKPEIIFHAAAYKHVPMMEDFPEEAIKVNVQGTDVLARLCCMHDVEKFVLISTDKAVNPTNVMGATKRIAEEVCLAHNDLCITKFIAVRFGNVLGSRGSVVPIFIDQIRNGGPVTITHPEVKRYFMTIPEAVLLVMQAGEMGKGGEVFVLDMGEPVKILDMAKQLIQLHGLVPDKDIPIEFIGLRPGEKMFEELLKAEEGVEDTSHELIHKAICRKDVNTDELEMVISQLLENIENGDTETLRNHIKKIVPTYSFKEPQTITKNGQKSVKEYVD